MKTIIYKLYVIALLILVIWAAQFMYPLIWWEVEFVGVDKKLNLKKGEPELLRMRKIRNYLDNHTRVKKVDLGDILIEEHYEKGHFHHVGQPLVEPSLNGCDYCHTVFAHQKDKEARAFRNMHGYFLACESCHYFENIRKSNVEHGWVKVGTINGKSYHPLDRIKESLSEKGKLDKAKGNYGARIIPLLKNGKYNSIIGKSSLQEAKKFLSSYTTMSQAKIKRILKRMHDGLTKTPFECDKCHTKKNVAISYRKLGYKEAAATKLKDTAVAGLLSKYEKFHFPNLFIRKDDRERVKDRELGQ